MFKKSFRYFGYFAVALAIAACSHSHEGHSHEGHEHGASESHFDHDHEGDEHGATEANEAHAHEAEAHVDGEITIAPERAAQLGIRCVEVSVGDLYDVVEVGGEVIPDPAAQGVVVAPAPGSVQFVGNLSVGSKVAKGQSVARIDGSGVVGGDANAAARLAYEAAKAELDRITPLRESGIVTVGEYNAALQAFNAAKLALSTRGNSAVSPVAGVLTSIDVANGQYVETGQPIATVVAEGGVVVRADLPKRYAQRAAAFKSAVVLTPSGERVVVERKQGTVTAAPGGYLPLYFAGASAGLTGGSFVKLWLQGDSGRQGITVPVSAVTERLGSKFVYVKLDDECYERRAVKLGTNDGTSVEVTDGLRPGEEVVVEGVTFVRLAETANVAPESHHHH